MKLCSSYITFESDHQGNPTSQPMDSWWWVGKTINKIVRQVYTHVSGRLNDYLPLWSASSSSSTSESSSVANLEVSWIDGTFIFSLLFCQKYWCGPTITTDWTPCSLIWIQSQVIHTSYSRRNVRGSIALIFFDSSVVVWTQISTSDRVAKLERRRSVSSV